MNSMTGFSQAEGAIGEDKACIDLKSVNHRYMEVKCRLPFTMAAFETLILEKLKKTFERGFFEVSIRMLPSKKTVSQTQYRVDELALESMMESADFISKKYQIPKDISIDAIIQSNKVLLPVDVGNSVEWGTLEKVLETAIENLKTKRNTEGSFLLKTFKNDIHGLKKIASEIGPYQKKQSETIYQELLKRIKQWQLKEIDPTRMEQEVAILTDKSDFSEELVRVSSHLVDFENLLTQTKTLGKKLEFIIQEIHREFNTLGSKTTLIEVSRLVIEAKSLIEKLRQQVQNVE